MITRVDFEMLFSSESPGFLMSSGDGWVESLGGCFYYMAGCKNVLWSWAGGMLGHSIVYFIKHIQSIKCLVSCQ